MAGLAFVVLLVLAVILTGSAPGTDAAATTISAYVLAHYHSLQAAVVAGALAALAFLIFAGQLSARLRRADVATGDSWMPCFLLGAAGTVALQLAGLAVQGGYQGMAHTGTLPENVLLLFRVANALVAASGIPLAVMLSAAAASGLLNGTIPVPLSWLGLVTAAVAVVGAGGMGTARTSFGVLYQISTLLLLVWVVGLSLWLLLRRDPQVGP